MRKGFELMKNLIAYFSHEKENYVDGEIKVLDIGNTKVVAQKIHKILGGDLFEIQPLHEYPYRYKECTELAKKELAQNARPKIKNIVSHIEAYDNIYLGFPNWWSTMPMCLWTFLESYNLSHKNIFPFCTHEGSGMGHSESDIERLCPNSKVYNGLAIKGSQVLNSDVNIRKWIEDKMI